MTHQIPNNKNVTWHNGHVTKAHREKLHGHKGMVVWFTGLSASGKSTIAHYLEKILHESGHSTYVFDGDNVRHGLCSDLGFSKNDRTENIRRIGEMVHLFIDAGTIAITAFISPYVNDRQLVRAIVGEENYIEVFVDCPVETCIARDPKGIYKKAMTGEIQNFTGISAPYEKPESPDIIIRSDSMNDQEAAEGVFHLMKKRMLLRQAYQQKKI